MYVLLINNNVHVSVSKSTLSRPEELPDNIVKVFGVFDVYTIVLKSLLWHKLLPGLLHHHLPLAGKRKPVLTNKVVLHKYFCPDSVRALLTILVLGCSTTIHLQTSLIFVHGC